MASKNRSSNLVDVENDDSEINFKFEDFQNSSAAGPNSINDFGGQATYFNSFPDSAEDDQEQKLLDDEDELSKTKSAHSFWTFEYYQQFFDVESKQVADRILWSMVPKPGVNYLQSYIRPNPDLYGPFWICITLVFTTAISGNLSNYLQTPDSYRWRYDFHKVTLATSSIFSYAWLVPLMIWGVLLWRGSKANVSLLEMICLYGYSMAIFVPVSLLWMIPLRWLQWCLGIVAAVLSGSVLVRTIQPALSHEAKKIAYGLAVLVLVLHAALALGFMLYFFYPPTIKAASVEVQVDKAIQLNSKTGIAGHNSTLNQTSKGIKRDEISKRQEISNKDMPLKTLDQKGEILPKPLAFQTQKAAYLKKDSPESKGKDVNILTTKTNGTPAQTEIKKTVNSTVVLAHGKAETNTSSLKTNVIVESIATKLTS